MVLAMIVLSVIGIGTAGGGHGGGSVVMMLSSGLALVAVVVLFVRYADDPLTERLARVPELLVIFAIALAAMFAAVGDFVGLGKEVGGLMAGVALASTPYREIIAARLVPLRDFLLLFFFIALGATLDLSLLGTHVTGAILFSLFVLIGNALIGRAIMGAMGYRERTGFLDGLTVAQICEFSLIFVAIGVSIGHGTEDALGVFERKSTLREPSDTGAHAASSHRIIMIGLGHFGTAIGLRLHKRGIRVPGMDFSPQAVRRWRELGLEADFGDANDPEFVTGLPFGGQSGWSRRCRLTLPASAAKTPAGP